VSQSDSLSVSQSVSQWRIDWIGLDWNPAKKVTPQEDLTATLSFNSIYLCILLEEEKRREEKRRQDKAQKQTQ
jgi:hypothetical protein